MRLVVEAMSLIPGQTGGIETYVRNLLAQMAAQSPEDEFVIALGDEAAGSFARLADNVHEFNADTRLSRLFSRHRLARTLLQCRRLAQYLRRNGCDILHCTMSFPKPFWGSHPMLVTIHDVGVAELAHHWRGTKPGLADSLMARATRRANAILAVSHFAKSKICERYRVPENRVTAVYNGVDLRTFRPAESPQETEKDTAVAHKYAISRNFLFFPANTHRHKNHLRLLDALGVLQARYGLAPTVVLTGAPAAGHGDIMKAIEDRGLFQRLRWLGRVPIGHLVALYRSAALLVFPSLYEGFGLPIVEAMACGCPVVCSRTTACGEVAGDAALTFDPTDVNEIADCIATVLTNAARRQDLVARGLERAEQFTWTKCAAETLAIYGKVAARDRTANS